MEWYDGIWGWYDGSRDEWRQYVEVEELYSTPDDMRKARGQADVGAPPPHDSYA